MSTRFPLGKEVRKVREKLNLTVEELAKELDTEPDNLYRWEREEVAPRHDHRKKLDKWLDSVNWKDILKSIQEYPDNTEEIPPAVGEKSEEYIKTNHPNDPYREKYFALLEASNKDKETVMRMLNTVLTDIHENQQLSIKLQALMIKLELARITGEDELKIKSQIAEIEKQLKKVLKK